MVIVEKYIFFKVTLGSNHNFLSPEKSPKSGAFQSSISIERTEGSILSVFRCKTLHQFQGVAAKDI